MNEHATCQLTSARAFTTPARAFIIPAYAFITLIRVFVTLTPLFAARIRHRLISLYKLANNMTTSAAWGVASLFIKKLPREDGRMPASAKSSMF